MPPTPTSAGPIPSILAYPLEEAPESLGDIAQWQAEWKWDGIRSQLIRRGGQTFLWSRGEELVTERYPELAAVGDALPDGTVIDGEILPFKDGHVLPFTMLQKRIGRKAVTKSILSQVPVVIMAFDLLEHAGADLAPGPARRAPRRACRHHLGPGTRVSWSSVPLRLSPVVAASAWEELATIQASSREHEAEGLMLKRLELGLRRGPAAGRLVEMEDRAAHDRRRADSRPARQRQARQPVHRLHVRRLGHGHRRARADRQGLLGTDRRGDPPRRRLRPHAT